MTNTDSKNSFKTETQNRIPSQKQRGLGYRGALLLFFTWGFLGLMLGIGFIGYLSEGWQAISGNESLDIPPNIFITGALIAFISILLCGIMGMVIGLYRARRWGPGPARLTGIVGPVSGVFCSIGGNILAGPTGCFIGALVGLVPGIHFGKKRAMREKI
jgi:ABC-type Fe3+ transport system permease subunit